MSPKIRSNSDSLAARLVPLVLVASVIALGCFYTLLYFHDNRAPEIDLSGFAIGPQAGFDYGMDKCRTIENKLAVSGWLVRTGKEPHRRSTQVVLLDHAARRGYLLETRLRERAGGPSSGQVAKVQSDPLFSGFSASLNPSVAGRRIQDGQMYIAYDDGTRRVLLPLSCYVRWP